MSGSMQMLRQELALRAFQHTARYDAIIARALSKRFGLTDYPEHLAFAYDRIETLRYGENSHQRAAFYRKAGPRNVAEPSIVGSQQLHGKQLSYNNILDADVALEAVKEFPERPACVIVKHATPCGIAQADSVLQAYKDALECDPYSPFGGIVAVNRELDGLTAREIAEGLGDGLAHLDRRGGQLGRPRRGAGRLPRAPAHPPRTTTTPHHLEEDR